MNYIIQHILVCIVLILVLIYIYIRIKQVFLETRSGCYGCKGCALKAQIIKNTKLHTKNKEKKPCYKKKD